MNDEAPKHTHAHTHLLVLAQEVRGPVPAETAYGREAASRHRYQRGQQRNPHPPYDNRQALGPSSWPEAPGGAAASWSSLGGGAGGTELGVGVFAGGGGGGMMVEGANSALGRHPYEVQQGGPGSGRGGGDRHAYTSQQQQRQQARWGTGGLAGGSQVTSPSHGGGGGGGGGGVSSRLAQQQLQQQQQQRLLLQQQQQQRPSWVADSTTGAMGLGANGIDFGRPSGGSNAPSGPMPVGGGMRDTVGGALGASGGGSGGGFGGHLLGDGRDAAYREQQQQAALVAHRRNQQQEQQQAQVCLVLIFSGAGWTDVGVFCDCSLCLRAGCCHPFSLVPTLSHTRQERRPLL